jgi:hypothetical protein
VVAGEKVKDMWHKRQAKKVMAEAVKALSHIGHGQVLAAPFFHQLFCRLIEPKKLPRIRSIFY